MAQTPDKADLQNALDKLRSQLDGDIFQFFTDTYQVQLLSASDALNDAIHNAGQAPKAGLCLPGPTTVWIDGQNAPLWQPLVNNSGIFSDPQNWIELNPSNKFGTAALYAFTVSLNLLYLKTALVWEVNENLRYYEKLKVSYQNEIDTYNTLHLNWQMAGSDPATKPAAPTTPEPMPPTGGDDALGSEVRDSSGTIITDVGSHLGKVSSKWAIATRDLLNDKDAKGNAIEPITYLQKVLDAYKQGYIDKNKTITDRLAKIVLLQMPIGAVWDDTESGTVGFGMVPGLNWLQADIYKETLAGNLDHDLIVAAKLDKLTADDVTKLQATVDKWRDTLKMYQGALKTLDDGPLDPGTI